MRMELDITIMNQKVIWQGVMHNRYLAFLFIGVMSNSYDF